jgi:hypothetical protein
MLKLDMFLSLVKLLESAENQRDPYEKLEWPVSSGSSETSEEGDSWEDVINDTLKLSTRRRRTEAQIKRADDRLDAIWERVVVQMEYLEDKAAEARKAAMPFKAAEGSK